MINFKTSLIIIFLLIIIFTCGIMKTLKEGLTNSNYIILIGDSVLNNSIYVPSGKSVSDFLKSKTNNVLNLAKDGATIIDLYSQLDKISIDLNNSNTYIFISACGNDILNSRTQLNDMDIKNLFEKYINFLKALKVKLGDTEINVLNLYLPTNLLYLTYKSSIDQWNKLIRENSNKDGFKYNIIDLHSQLTKPSDFVYDIEPSESASEKIANLIYLTR